MFLSNLTARDMADEITARIDGGVSAGIMRVYDDNGAGIPADADTALTTQVLLAEITLNDPSFAAAVDAAPGGRIDLDVTPEPEDTSANATGVANFSRIDESGGTTIVQLTTSVTGGGGEVEINSVNIQIGGSVVVTGGSITMPES